MEIHEMLFDDRSNGKKSRHFEDNGNVLIVTSKNAERIYKRRNINLSEQRAKELAKDLRNAYGVKTRAVKQSPRWSVFVERQVWGN